MVIFLTSQTSKPRETTLIFLLLDTYLGQYYTCIYVKMNRSFYNMYINKSQTNSIFLFNVFNISFYPIKNSDLNKKCKQKICGITRRKNVTAVKLNASKIGKIHKLQKYLTPIIFKLFINITKYINYNYMQHQVQMGSVYLSI